MCDFKYHLVIVKIAMENIGKSPFLIGKPSISMGHLYHGYVSHNLRVNFDDLIIPNGMIPNDFP